MAFIQLDSLHLAFGDRTIFTDVQLTISPGSRIALTGANGTGKSTLMKVAAGISEFDSGRVIRPKGTRVSYLPQSGIVHQGRSLREEAAEAFAELKALEDEAHEIATQLEQGEDNHQPLLDRYQEIHDTLEHAEWDRRDARIEQILTGLGFSREELEQDVSTFSGGWQMRIALSKILLGAPDVLLLDEPTNYLDLEARDWLRDFLKRYPGGVLLVSHDRGFLDNTCNQVAELLMTRLNIFKGTYSAYEIFREKDMADLVERWKRQQEEIAKTETFIERFRSKATKAKQVQSRIKMLEKIERIEIPPALKRIRFHFPEAPHSGKMPLRGENLGKRYDTKTVFSQGEVEFPRGSRTAVVGVNGAGKTTLLRIISGEDQNHEGALIHGSGVKIGYFCQDQEQVLDPSLTVLEEAAKGSSEGEGRLRSLLGAFLFSGDDIHKKVGILSGGERNRLALLKILLEPVNLLILDEPTNHLDIHSKDILLEALEGFGGTLVIVSHDRYFLEKIADRVLEVEDGGIRTYLGDYAYYRWRKENPDGIAQSEPSSPSSTGIQTAKEVASSSAPGISREEQKKRRSLINKWRKEEEELTSRLEAKEEEANQLRSALELPENYSDPEKAHDLSAKLMAVEERIEQITAAWEEAAANLEEAQSLT
ncbi:MAG: ABC-F family ATP-binding cassette domain-containing protein [Spirochaetales bacterium]|nr:ABC-F family ATP-binding cassette domain-containing protein [Spirochaetales bacterium]